ncbi:hypothetical protein, partial [Klebsiella pneumoniae]|uniref:hypothetical protein n=1 Tax=Klebsiella pneumoniae TaxID=573 RepID=UPI001C6F9C4B
NDFMDSVHHIWCPLSSQEYQDLPDGAETTLTVPGSKLLGEVGFQRSHLRIALFSSAYYERVSSWQQAYRPLPGR